ncbi:MAG: universal stress protein [Methylobacterium sp.]|jgi:nucleotide-binding universal stress UspA family protein|nr:universal stress protein [Methylobacterium sp.]
MSRRISPLSSLSCIIRLTEEGSSVAVRDAITLAAPRDAHLLVTIVAAKASVPFSPIGAGYVGPMVEEINEKVRIRGAALAESLREKLRRGGVTGTVRLVLNHVDIVAEEAVRLARATDLVVLDQPGAALDTKDLILEEALFHSGRPILVAVTRKAMVVHPRRIVVGWDGSAHAARAVGDALALFPGIEMAEIVSVDGEKDLSNALPGSDLARHLAHKGVTTTLAALSAKGTSVGSVLDRHAMRTDADLIVMGGFGHSRLSEFLFGGVTVELTEGASVPLLIAY